MTGSAVIGAPGGARSGAALCSALIWAAMAAACGSDTALPPAPEGDPVFSAIHGDTLAATCALGSCHGGAAPAAGLDFHLVSADDIVNICYALVDRPSCLFPDRRLVVPFKPEASFLIDKLRGTALEGEPDLRCAATNRRMPFGLPPLTDNQIKQVEDWISTGAGCAGPRPIDAAVDAPIDADLATPGDVASVTAPATTIAPGQRLEVTVALTQPAPHGGQTVQVTTGDDTVLGVPSAVRVEAGETAVSFDVLGKRSAPPVVVTAATGSNEKSIEITVAEAAMPGVDAAANGRSAATATTTWAEKATPTRGHRAPTSL